MHTPQCPEEQSVRTVLLAGGPFDGETLEIPVTSKSYLFPERQDEETGVQRRARYRQSEENLHRFELVGWERWDPVQQ